MAHPLPTALGQSGARIELVDRPEGRAVRKVAAPGTAARLHVQAKLQAEHFTRLRGESHIHTAEVYEVSGEHFDMEHVAGRPLGEYLLTAPRDDARANCDKLLDWLRANLRHGEPADHSDALRTKLAALGQKSGWNEVLWEDSTASMRRLDAAFAASAPYSIAGTAHGDLSFDNILVEDHSRRLVLIDFLDNVVSSPILDAARLYLDARFAWWASHGRPRNRLLLAGRHLAGGIEDLVTDAAIDPMLFRSCFALNVLRILPYTHQPVRRGLLIHALHRGAPHLFS